MFTGMLGYSRETRLVDLAAQLTLLGKIKKNILDMRLDVHSFQPSFCFSEFVDQPFDLPVEGSMELVCSFCKFLHHFNQLYIDQDSSADGV